MEPGLVEIAVLTQADKPDKLIKLAERRVAVIVTGEKLEAIHLHLICRLGKNLQISFKGYFSIRLWESAVY
jgi:hypothetical protein